MNDYKKLIKFMIRFVIVCMAFCTPMAYAGQATGTVNVVSVNTYWGGFFVQLDNPVTQSYEAACPSANWAFFPISDPAYHSMLAILLAARASGQVVVVYTNGCITSPAGTQPRLWVVDYGIRTNGS